MREIKRIILPAALLMMMLLLLVLPSFAVEIQGKVSAVAGKNITIKVDSAQLPNVGDKVDVSFTTPDGEVVPVGVWRISKAEASSIEAKVVESSGDPNVDMSVVIHSDNPRVPQESIEKENDEEEPPGSGKRLASLDATLSNLRFYESRSEQVLPVEQRRFQHSFAPASEYIYWEFTLDYTTSRRVDFVTTGKYYRDGRIVATTEYNFYLDPKEPQTWYTGGYRIGGGWPEGRYEVEILINGAKEASGSFVVTGKGK